jgi:phage protein D
MPAIQDRQVPSCRIDLGGSPLPAETAAALVRVEIDLDVDLFGQCTLLFHDPELKLINGSDFASGAGVKVELGFESARKALFEGEVVALEPQFRRDVPPALRVVCQDPLHRLALTQMTRSLNNVDDKEVVTLIAREHGLSAEAPAGSKTHELQGNVTDAVLLRRLAQKQGNHVRIEGKKLIVGPPPNGHQVSLGPDSGISRARVKVNTMAQVSEISVHGWDPVKKREFNGTAKAQGEAGEGGEKHGGSAVISFAGHEVMPVDPKTAEEMAKGRLRKIAEGFVTAEVEMAGDPELLPGATVKIEKMDAQLDGSWRVEHATHQYSKRGYRVRFRAVRTAKAQPPKYKATAEKAETAREPPPKDVYLISAQVKSIGGTILANHPVRILDERGRRVGEVLITDAEGVVRAQVPANKRYRIEILDDDLGVAPVELHPDAPAVLLCHFFDEAGAPVAGEAVEAKADDDKLELRTDENGRVEAPARLAVWELTVRGQTFHAHSLLAADREKDENHYRFVVGEPGDVHLISVELKGLGDTPLANHKARVLDPETGLPVTDWLESDDDGILRARVPDDRGWRVEILDEGLEEGAADLHPGEETAVLLCRFVDAAGGPVADEPVEVSLGEEKLSLKTDEQGKLSAPARLAAYELKVREHAFTAHAVPVADRELEEAVHVFVLGEPGDVHMIAVEVKGLGGTPLPHHPVRVLDPDTGEPASDWLETDEEGVLRTRVPDDRTWRIEVQDEDLEAGTPQATLPEAPAVLRCLFVDAGGIAVANEPVEATVDSDALALRTDGNGRIEAPARLAVYRLKIRGQTFTAHAVTAADGSGDETLYRFVLETR